MKSSLNSFELLQNYSAQTCFSGRANFFKAHHPSTEKLGALVGFEPRTKPEFVNTVQSAGKKFILYLTPVDFEL